MRSAAALVLAAAASLAAPPAVSRYDGNIEYPSTGEARVRILAGCARCDWGATGREAAVLKISIDGRYSQHLPLTRGEDPAEYYVGIGTVTGGVPHRLTIERDPKLSAVGTGAVSIQIPSHGPLLPGRGYQDSSTDYIAQGMAPILYARPNTVGRFTDVPLVMWYEIAPTARGRQYRYSVIFSNEDGGTPTDRLMATWGRTTDIEYVYGVEFDQEGQVLAEEFQGPNHELRPFAGKREGTHPLLWVATDNNMVSDRGTTTVRYAPAPERFDLENKSREFVMDENPWLYQVAAREMVREGKIDDGAAAGSGLIPDLRRFAHVEACTTLQSATVAFSVRGRSADGRTAWFDADRGLPEFRIARTGCFRGAVPLPEGTAADNAVRFRAYSKMKPGDPPPSAVLLRVNTVMTLWPALLPSTAVRPWIAAAETVLPVDGGWVEVELERRR